MHLTHTVKVLIFESLNFPVFKMSLYYLNFVGIKFRVQCI